MTDEHTSPELRVLADQLFAAGRAERPGPALARRLSMIEPGAIGQGTRQREGHAEGEQRRLTRSRRSSGALAAVLALAAGMWLWLAAEAQPVIVMTADPARSAATPVVEQVAKVVVSQEAPSTPSAAAAASPTAVKPAPRTRATRVRTAPSPKALDAVPPSPSPSAMAAQPASTQNEPLTLREELALLKRARSSLRSDNAAQALALLDQHARERGGNGLGAEAALLRIEALAALGRSTDASELATRFVRENPNNALGDRAKSFITSKPTVIKPAPAGHEDAKGVD